MAQVPLTQNESELADALHGPREESVSSEPNLVSAIEEPKSKSEPLMREPEPLVARHFVAPALIPIERIASDLTYSMRGEESRTDVAPLAMDIARLGQLFPIDLRLIPASKSVDGVSGFQIISGFRRVEALRFLQREKVLARLHTDLSDTDALLMALAAAVHNKSVSREELAAHFESETNLPAVAKDMLEKALSEDSELSPEGMEEEVDADELAADCTSRLGQVNQDLSLLADVFAELNSNQRDELLNQLRYSAQLVTFLEEKL
jgi:ParB family transcriptional regulator, chromosome partitioning protein